MGLVTNHYDIGYGKTHKIYADHATVTPKTWNTEPIQETVDCAITSHYLDYVNHFVAQPPASNQLNHV
eukprot:2189872-Lingulodinium_polyedra.AAC.1